MNKKMQFPRTIRLALCLLVSLDCCLSFNIEDREPIVKTPPTDQEKGYFGFSVALHKSTNEGNIKDNWILVGAPLGQNKQPGSNHSGALYKCPISTTPSDCEQVTTDGQKLDFDYNDEDTQKVVLTPPEPNEIKTGQWLGVTVKSQRPGGQVVVCAHRYIESFDLSKFHYGQGLCYLLNADLTVDNALQYCKGRPTEHLHQQYGLCQLGTSANFINDFIVIGAPGPYTWRGTLFGQVIEGDYLTRDKTIYKGPLNDNQYPIEKYSYVGMSVGGGRFLSKVTYTYFSGAPRGDLVGLVYLFTKEINHDELKNISIIRGNQFASGFGYETAAMDVNSDGYDDLFVGAPFYYDDKIGGAVYIYYNIRKCYANNNCTPDQILMGKSQSRFGLSIASLGDINKDGYNDVAIGAPYEEHGAGAVYIYLGSKNGVGKEPSQIITVKNHKTFGYSLSGGLDMDENGYPDLLVGAFESDKAFLYKTRPIIDIEIQIKGDELNNINASRKGCASFPNDLNHTCFSFQSCFKIKGSFKKQEKLNIKSHMKEEKKKLSSRVWFYDPTFPDSRVSEREKTIMISPKQKLHCEAATVYIRDSVSDILSPILFSVQYSLQNNNINTPILNKTSVQNFKATFQKNCGSDDICESRLILDAGTNLTKTSDGEYIINFINEDFILEINVTNEGESAYEAKLYVEHPAALSYIALKNDDKQSSQVKCSSHNTTVSCELGNPFNSNQIEVLKLRFETIKSTKEQKLHINITVNSTSKELSDKTSVGVVAILQKIAEFKIRGMASSNLFYGGQVLGESAMKDVEDIGARVKHKYQLDNLGQWTLPNVAIKIKWPYQVASGEDSREGKWLLYLESLPEISDGIGKIGSCSIRDEDNIVNPLNLTISENELNDEPENLMRPEDVQYTYSDDNQTLWRRRREVEYVVPATVTEKGGTRRKYVTMDCNKRTARCAEIICRISSLARRNQAIIDIKSRIWNSTLVEDYNNVDWVTIRSTAEVIIEDTTFEISEDSRTIFSAETLLYPVVLQTDSNLNWYIIGGSILAGIILLIILILILWKCGFFKRKRMDQRQTGKVARDESDELLKK